LPSRLPADDGRRAKTAELSWSSCCGIVFDAGIVVVVIIMLNIINRIIITARRRAAAAGGGMTAIAGGRRRRSILLHVAGPSACFQKRSRREPRTQHNRTQDFTEQAVRGARQARKRLKLSWNCWL
jgi:hypothetical protein